MLRTWLGVLAPVAVSLAVFAALWALPLSAAVSHGVAGGVLIALIQSLLSVAAMKRAWTTKWFYWSWAGGIFFRMAVFAVTGWVTYRGVGWDFLSTMLSLVVATTIFLVFESMTIFGKR